MHLFLICQSKRFEFVALWWSRRESEVRFFGEEALANYFHFLVRREVAALPSRMTC